jgi:dTDP-4-amino-4,6-dideoxygalactose transaminase
MSVASISFYPPLSPGVYLRPPATRLPFPLQERRCALFSRGRHAIWQAARALGLGDGAEVLAPAWHHGAEIEALGRAGAQVVFYEPGPLLEPDAAELDALLGPRTRALFLTHYLGFPQDAARWRGWCDQRGLLLFEDAAHACMAWAGARPVGSYGDAAVWCLFKSFAVPDGAALHLLRAGVEPELEPTLDAAGAARRHAAWVLQRAPALARAAGRRSRGGRFDLSAEIALGHPGTPPSTVTTHLLARLADEGAAARRRANYLVLLEELSEQVPPPFERLPDGAVPLGLPMRCSDKAATVEELVRRGIDAVDFWSEPHPSLPSAGFAETRRRRESTVLLPVHQELRPHDLERIAAAVRPRRRRVPEMRIERAGSIAELREEWSELALRAANVFATPEWTAAWARHFLRWRRLELLAFRSGAGRLIGVLPLYRLAERPLRILRVAGHGPVDYTHLRAHETRTNLVIRDFG